MGDKLFGDNLRSKQRVAINEENNNKKLNKEINMKNVITINTKTVTPLLQYDTEGKQRNRYELLENQSVSVPFFSANGLRGLMRRVATKDMIDRIIKKDSSFKIKAEELHLYTAGASSDKRSIETVTYKEVEGLRLKAPILSLFGAGLSQISGKLAVSDLKPSVDMDMYYEVKGSDEKTRLKSKVIGKSTFTRVDETQRSDFFTDLMDMEDVERWSENYKKAVATKKGKKEAGTEDVENSVKQLPDIEYIVPGVELKSCINPVSGVELSEVELGLVLKTLKEISMLQIGAGKRYNFGLLDWEIKLNGVLMVEAIRDKDYVANFVNDNVVTDEAIEYIKKYEEWADENYSADSITIKDLLKKL